MIGDPKVVGKEGDMLSQEAADGFKPSPAAHQQEKERDKATAPIRLETKTVDHQPLL